MTCENIDGQCSSSWCDCDYQRRKRANENTMSLTDTNRPQQTAGSGLDDASCWALPVQRDFFSTIEGERLVCWFSCGVTSAVACKIALAENAGGREVVIAYCSTGWATKENGWKGEHIDSLRFLKECEEWFNHPITILKHPKYETPDDVIEGDRYLNGPDGARCTKLLKIQARLKFQRVETDIQVFGFDSGEIDRAADFRQAWPEVRLYTPLIKRDLKKPDCLAIMREVGIELPAMYRMGYRNNNCIGCVKGGKGYWNKIRADFPEAFTRRSAQERILGRSCIRGTFLDDLDPQAGRYEAEPDISCGGTCVQMLKEVEACQL